MKKTLFITALLFAPFATFAQQIIQGTITDAETGATIEGVYLRTLNFPKCGAVSSANGSYTMRCNGPARDVLITHVGYMSDTVTMDLRRGEFSGKETLVRDIRLRPIVFQVGKEVVISAPRTDYHSGIVFTDIKREDIVKNNTARDLPFLLESVPGINITSDAGNGTGYTGLRIRGSDATRINVTIDGIPINDPESQLLYWVNMPDLASSIDNIQVQRGAGTSTNGVGSFGGGIHITTNRPAAEAFGEISLAAGSFNTQRATVKAGTGMINNRWNFEARLSKITSDGYVDRASSDLKSYFLTGGYYGTKHSVRMNAFSGKEVTYQSWYGIPEAALDTNRTFNYYTYDNQVDDYQQDHYQLFHSWKANERFTMNTALHFTYGRGFYEEYETDAYFSDYLLEDVIIGGDTLSQTDLIRRKWLDNRFYGVTTSADIKAHEHLRINIGAAYNEYDGDHFGEVIWSRFASNGFIRHRYYDNNGFKTDMNGFAKATWTISERLTAYADVQLRHVEYDFTGFDEQLAAVPQSDAMTFMNPKGGLTYTTAPGKYGYVSFSSASKEPSRDDYTESSVSSRPKAEKLLDIESGYSHTQGTWSVLFNYFLMLYKDQLVLTGQINDVGNYTRTNVPESFREGMEAEFKWQPFERWKLAGNTTLSRHQIKEFREFIDDYDVGGQLQTVYTNTDIAFSPNVTGFLQLGFQARKNILIEAVSRYTGKQYLDNTSNNNKSIDPYMVADLRIHWQPSIKNIRTLSFSAMIQNVFDEQYESNGYTFGYVVGGTRVDENYYYPQAGRNFMLKMEARF